MLKALRWGVIVACTLGCSSTSVICLWLILRGGAGHTNILIAAQPTPVAVVVDYKDFVSILLTAIGVMIALGSIGIAGLAIFGYAEGRKMVEGIVKQAVNDQLQPAVFRALADLSTAKTSAADASRIASSTGSDNEV